ncbi:hypothetical protein CRENBAI_020109, partial [Crenichthys baileyi]
SSQQRPCLYNAKWSSFPSLKEVQRDRITMVTAVTCSLAGRQNEPPHPTATETAGLLHDEATDCPPVVSWEVRSGQ